MLGIRFDRVMHMRNGIRVARGWYVFLGFYWFCFAIFRKWPLDFMDSHATGFSFSYKPKPDLTEGDLMWSHNKKYLRFETRRDFYNAA